MARTPEATFRDSVHKYLPPQHIVYRMPNSNRYVSGVPDTYYEGDNGALWVEWKKVPKIPRVWVPGKKGTPTSLQRDWLHRAHMNRVNVAVIVGCPAGGVFMRDFEWNKEWTQDEFFERVVSRKQLANYIAAEVVARTA